ncbi:MAG: cyclic-phosphate processing receiver domain-containing protein [Schlesneria sp.]
MRLIVLEDNADRQNEMQRIVGDRMPQYSFEFFNDVAAMIERLDTTGLYDVALISLDHDLDLISSSDGSHIDPGTGVDAAKWFAMQPALAPLIVHTTNTLGGDRMMDILLECGWHCSRIVPYSGEDWINESWFPLVRKLVVAHCASFGMAACGLQILKCNWRMGNTANQVLTECIRAARYQLVESATPNLISIQLYYLNSDDEFTQLVPKDGVLGQMLGIFLNLTVLTMELEDAIGTGPKTLEELKVSSQFQEELKTANVKEIQIDVIQVPAAEPIQALMVSTSQSENAPLNSHRSQEILSDLKTLLELSLLYEFQRPKEKPTLTRPKKKV